MKKKDEQMTSFSLKKVVAQLLRIGRLKENLTQSQLAEKAGLSQSDLSDVENGRSMDLDKIYKITVALDIRLSELILSAENALRNDGLQHVLDKFLLFTELNNKC
ncbi:MAG: helix-turn-helix domain-containing protein [Candidatus Sericytochromatia bacterium]